MLCLPDKTRLFRTAKLASQRWNFRLEDAIVKTISAKWKVDEEQAKELRILGVDGPKW